MRTDGWTDGRIDLTKLIVAFGNFANAPNHIINILCIYNSGIMLRVN